jgi:fluoride exporter
MQYVYKLLILSAGGVLGTVARYLFSGLSYRLLGSRFAWGTLVVNLLGCLVIGFGTALAEDKLLLTPNLRLFWFAGFCGAFTTFSTLIFESAQFMRQGDLTLAGLNLVGSVALGLLVFVLGLFLGRAI